MGWSALSPTRLERLEDKPLHLVTVCPVQSQQSSRAIGGRLRIFARERLNLGHERIHLVGCGADEAAAFGEDGLELFFAEADALVAGDEREQVDVAVGAAGAQRLGRGERVFLDRGVRGFAAGAVLFTASIKIVVVGRKGRLRSFSAAMAAGKISICMSTVRNVSSKPSMAKNASGSATRRTTEHETSPSFHWWPARPAVMVT